MDDLDFGSYFNDIKSCKEDVKYPINPRLAFNWRIWKYFHDIRIIKEDIKYPSHPRLAFIISNIPHISE